MSLINAAASPWSCPYVQHDRLVVLLCATATKLPRLPHACGTGPPAGFLDEMPIWRPHTSVRICGTPGRGVPYFVGIRLFTAQGLHGRHAIPSSSWRVFFSTCKADRVRSARNTCHDALSGFDQFVREDGIQDLLLEFQNIITDRFHLFPNSQTWYIGRTI